MVVPLPNLRDGVKVYRETLAAGGHPVNSDELSLAIPIYVAKDPQEAQAVPEASAKSYISIALKAVAEIPSLRDSLERLRTMTYDDYCSEIAIYETPHGCVERLKALVEEFRPGGLMFWFNQGGLIDHSKVMGSMRLFAQEVMPHFR